MRHRFQLKGDFVTRYNSTASIEGELYQLLRERLPLYRSRRGRLDVSKLANALGMSPEGVYLWLRHDDGCSGDSLSLQTQDDSWCFDPGAGSDHRPGSFVVCSLILRSLFGEMRPCMLSVVPQHSKQQVRGFGLLAGSCTT